MCCKTDVECYRPAKRILSQTGRSSAGCDETRSEMLKDLDPEGVLLTDWSVWSGFYSMTCKEWQIGWSSPYTERKTGENASNTGAYLFLVSVEKCMPNALKKDAVKNLNQSWMISIFVLAVALQTKFTLSSKFSRNLVCQRRLHMFCRPRESIRQVSSWKALGSVAGVRCWQSPVTGRQVTVFLLRSLWQRRWSWITIVRRGSGLR